MKNIRESLTAARIKFGIVRRLFPFFERAFDLHLTPNEYYSPIPSVKDLPDSLFEAELSLTGIDLREQDQHDFAIRASRYASEFLPTENGGLSLLDAFILYVLLRERKPGKMVEIGGGDSTLISLQALQRNAAEGTDCHFICIEPYPRPFLREAAGDAFELIEQKVQDVDTSVFDGAEVLFIDSSHVSKLGSDVNHEMFEIVPKTAVGTLIHWHDIVIPTNYWKDWTTSGRQFWNESYLLHAFLSFNDSFEVRWAARWYQLKHFETLKSLFPFLKPTHRNTSFWIERVK